MLAEKPQETKAVEKKSQPKKQGGVLSEEIFSSIKDYAIKGVEDEYKPLNKKEEPDFIVDI